MSPRPPTCPRSRRRRVRRRAPPLAPPGPARAAARRPHRLPPAPLAPPRPALPAPPPASPLPAAPPEPLLPVAAPPEPPMPVVRSHASGRRDAAGSIHRVTRPGRTGREQRQEQDPPAPDRWTRPSLAELHDGYKGSPSDGRRNMNAFDDSRVVSMSRTEKPGRGGAGAIGDLQRAQVRLIVHSSQRVARPLARHARLRLRARRELFHEARRRR